MMHCVKWDQPTLQNRLFQTSALNSYLTIPKGLTSLLFACLHRFYCFIFSFYISSSYNRVISHSFDEESSYNKEIMLVCHCIEKQVIMPIVHS